MSSLNDLIDEVFKNVKNCEGLIYKCKIEYYMNKKNEIVNKVKFVPQRKLSCKGCQNCLGYYFDDVRNDFNDFAPDNFHFDEPEDGALYYLDSCNNYHDPYTNEYDFDYILRRIK